MDKRCSCGGKMSPCTSYMTGGKVRRYWTCSKCGKKIDAIPSEYNLFPSPGV